MLSIRSHLHNVQNLTTAPTLVGIVKIGITRMIPANMMMILCKIFNWPIFLSFPPAGVLKVLPDVVLLPTASVVAHLNSHRQPVNFSLKMRFFKFKVSSEPDLSS